MTFKINDVNNVIISVKTFKNEQKYALKLIKPNLIPTEKTAFMKINTLIINAEPIRLKKL